MAQSEGRAQGRGAAIVVGLAFALAAAVTFAFSHLLRGQRTSARTGVGVLFAFAWAFATMAAAIPLMLRLGTLRAGVARTQHGGAAKGGATEVGTSSVAARPAWFSGGAMIGTRSRAPALFIGLSALLLMAAMLLMFSDRSTTPAGAAVGVMMLGWARSAWPLKTPFDPVAPALSPD